MRASSGRRRKQPLDSTFTAKTPITPMLRFTATKNALENGWTDPLRSNISIRDPSLQPDFILPQSCFKKSSKKKKKHRPTTATKRRVVVNRHQRWLQRSKQKNQRKKPPRSAMRDRKSQNQASEAYIQLIREQQQENEPEEPSAIVHAKAIVQSLPQLQVKLERFTSIQNYAKTMQRKVPAPDSKVLEAMIAKFREDQQALEKQLDDFVMQSL